MVSASKCRSQAIVLLFLTVIIAVLNSCSVEARIRRYKWEVKNEYKAPDCFRKTVITINAQTPGPTIRAQQHDTIIVEVTNNLFTENLAIHWHGIRQYRKGGSRVNPSLTVTDSRARHISGKTQISILHHNKRLLIPEKTQKEKGDNLQESYVSELVSYTSISLKQNNVQELRDIWDSWKNDRKQKFSQQYGDIALLLHVRIDEPLIRAMVQFWNPGYSCFTFNWEDMVLTIEEYTTLLHCENIKLGRVYVKHTKSQPFKSTLARVAGVDEKWVIDQTQRRGSGEGIEWIHIRQLMKNHPDEWKTIDLFALEELVEEDSLGVFSSFKYGFTATSRRPKGFPTVDLALPIHLWEIGYAPLLALRQYGARQFVPATRGLSGSEFGYHAAKNMLTPDYVECRRLRKNDNIPVPYCEDTRTMEEHLRRVPSELEIAKTEFEAEQKRVCFDLEDLRKGYQDAIKDNSKLKMSSEYWKGEAHNLKRKFEGPNERTWKEKMKIAQRRLADSQHQNQRLRIQMTDLEKQYERDVKTIGELEAIIDGFKKQAAELQIVPFDGGLQWRFRWEQAQQRVNAKDAAIRDFLDQVQKAARHLHGLAREAGVVRQGIQPVTDEGRRLVNLLENMSQKAKEKTPSLPLQTLNTHHPHNTRAKKRQMEARMEKLEENMARLQKKLEDKMAQNSQSTLESIKKNQESLVDQIVAKLSCLQKVSAEGGSPFEGVTMSPTSQVIMSPEILPRPQENSSAVKGKAPSAVKVHTSKTNPDNHPDDYSIPDFNEDDKAKKMEEKIRMIEDRMKIVQGDYDYYGVDARELSLVPDLVLPPKFKAPEFEKFDGNSCPYHYVLSEDDRIWRE
ncbi:hypothetical protein F3Y22_tig00111947pilonHSYRG00266 [Hibiscus syriacus]|uniref:Uncharacterized protein n=1 Tax=Hibiscus syriacus TaxID=106335 RepID=A0A6A2YDD6_HIBSY|nr:hypothetical protein F3Y22_tig00111947pilonHSYRG00266 [Hibiscus syriacus]